MANEATWIERHGYPPGNPVSYTVANGTAISAGTLLVLSSDPRTASASSGINQVFLGVVNSDKEANDGSTRIGADTAGIFDMTVVAGTADLPQIGDLVELSGANLIRAVRPRGVSGAEFISGAKFAFGRSLENASASEVIAVKIPY
jgi:hypothetical protein